MAPLPTRFSDIAVDDARPARRRIVRDADDPVIAGCAEAAAAHGFDLGGVARPADRVGGDFFDVFVAADGRLCIALGDVADKGAAAARAALRVRGMIREAGRAGSDPASILAAVNVRLAHGNDTALFVTLCVVSSSVGQSMNYACAGHHAPVMRDAQGTVRRLPAAPNIALGVLPDARFAAQSVRVEAGEALLLFTDGLTEAEGAEGRFGVSGAAAAFAGSPCAADVVAAMDAFAGRGGLGDDLAVLTLRRR